jgi:CHAD domain-containing protein
VAKARPIPGLSDDLPFASAAARVVAVRAAELQEHSHDVLDVGDIERVHDMRVATRRLRAALEVFEACFPGKRFKVALKEVKTLADALGERRDRDVTIAELERVASGLAAADRPGVESLIAALRAEQAEANEALAPQVAGDRLAALREQLDELVGEVRRRAGDDPDGEPTAVELASASEGNGSGVVDPA